MSNKQLKKGTFIGLTIVLMALIVFMVGLSAQDRIETIQLTSDPAQEGFPTWSPDGKYIVFSHTSRDDSLGKNGLWRMTSDGEDTKQIFKGIAEHPKWSPDGRYIVFDAEFGKSVQMIPAQGGDPIRILPDSVGIVNGGMPCWSPDGSKIVFLEGATMTLCVADIETGEVNRILHQEGLLPFPGCWTPDGTGILIALMDMKSRRSTMWAISTDGINKKKITGHHEGLYRYLTLSPDGSLLIYAAMEEESLGLWVMPVEGGKSIPLAVTRPGHNESPSVSPNGKKMTFTSTRSGNFDVWIMDFDAEKISEELQMLKKPNDFPVLKGLYLGQMPPGMTPEVFAPGIVSTEGQREFSGTFTPDGKEYYFFRFAEGAGMMVCRLRDEGWTAPEPASFNTEYIDNEPHITPDGKIMYFNSSRPFPGSEGERRPTQIWFMERRGDGWGDPKHLCEGMFATSARNGNVYLNLKVTRLENGKFAPFEEVIGAHNSPPSGWKRGHHSSIASDESFIIYDSQKIGSEWDSEENLFVCFHKKDGTWSEAFDLGGKMALPGGKSLATISPDGKYLFFCLKGDIYWVDAKIIEELKPAFF